MKRLGNYLTALIVCAVVALTLTGFGVNADASTVLGTLAFVFTLGLCGQSSY